MGLGKTLTMIALVAVGWQRRLSQMDPDEEGPKSVPSTLIVVPSACKESSADTISQQFDSQYLVMGTWKEQLSQCVATPAIELRANIAVGMF